jgi:hypothetical protein
MTRIKATVQHQVSQRAVRRMRLCAGEAMSFKLKGIREIDVSLSPRLP